MAVALRMDKDRYMSTVLVTGSGGQVGRAASSALEAAGWTVRTFDLANGQDLREPTGVSAAIAGCDAVVHAGAIPHDSRGTPADILATNVLGTWHVLLGAEAHRTSRVIYFSSAQVFGCAEGEGEPEYLPIDDRHPLRAARPYGMSKRLAEYMCEAWTSRTGIPTIVLRPVMILSDESLRTTKEDDVDFGAFVHLDDVADAVVKSMTAPVGNHVRVTLCGPGPFDTSAAQAALGWRPTHDWPR
jgi:UDP-glucose 4-epimerase